MKRKHIAVLFFLVSMMATSCSKVDALFNNGEPITEQRSISQPFDVICMHDNINVELVHSSHPRLELTCPKNLIDNIITEIQGDSLIIWNDNDHNWLRSFDYNIDLTVYYDSLREINYCSNGRLHSSDTLVGRIVLDTLGDYGRRCFMLRILEGCGDIDLTFNCDVMRNRFFNGTSCITLHGEAGYSEYILRAYGTVHAQDLNTNIVNVLSESTNDLYLLMRNGGTLNARLYSIGNVYYIGNPWVSKECSGDGQVIKIG